MNQAKAFAWQVVQACLRHWSVPVEFNGMALHSIMTMGDQELYAIARTNVLIYGAPCEISASLTLTRKATDEPWLMATCELYMVDNPARIWKFTASVVDHQIEVENTGHPDLAKPEYQYAQPGTHGPHQHD